LRLRLRRVLGRAAIALAALALAIRLRAERVPEQTDPHWHGKNRIGRVLRFRHHNNRSSAKEAFRSRDRVFRRMAVAGRT
jgi:hypothetical protein